MAREEQNNAIDAAVELIMQEGFDGFADAFRMLLNEAMRIERSRHLGADAWERSQNRQGYANGFKPKTMKSRLGELTFAVPQVRDGSFYPSALERGLRSERALKLALAEMVIQGVSTRKVAKITEELCGFEVSSTQVSRCTQMLDEELSAWRRRTLGACPYVVLDARYEKVRQGGQVVDCAVLVALGVRADGKRDILGPLPLGYDVQNRLLIVNEAEAAVVRRIFADFARDRSTTHMVRNYAAEGIRTKTGRTFCKQSIYKLLHNRMYLGEIVHKGRYYPGQHPPILTVVQWQAAHDVLAQTAEERRAAVATDGRGLPLLRGLLFTISGERLIPTHTVRKGRCYRYYTPAKDRHYGAGASNFGSLPAEPIEALVVGQVCQVLRAPESVQTVWDRVRASAIDLDEARVVMPMRQLAAVWPSLFAAEQRRLAQLLIERVLLGDDGLEILWRDAGWVELIDELRPGSIGAELAEVEMTV